jgi:hypothetical protein
MTMEKTDYVHGDACHQAACRRSTVPGGGLKLLHERCPTALNSSFPQLNDAERR